MKSYEFYSIFNFCHYLQNENGIHSLVADESYLLQEIEGNVTDLMPMCGTGTRQGCLVGFLQKSIKLPKESDCSEHVPFWEIR